MSLITNNEYEHIMNSQDEDFVFDKFFEVLKKYFKYFENVNITLDNFKQNTKFVFNINLKLFDIAKNYEDTDISNEELEEFRNAYDATKFILDSVDHIEDFGEDSILSQNIQIVKSFWEKKMKNQQELGESINSFTKSMDKHVERFENIFIVNKISSFVHSNLNNLNENMIEKLQDDYKILAKLLGECERELITKVTNNLKTDNEYYVNLVRESNVNKDMNDEIFVENIITTSSMISKVIEYLGTNKDKPE
jgi:hypothetical protein